jgi:hypothetical protein
MLSMSQPSRWEQYKQKSKTDDARFKDLFNKENYTEEELAKARMDICLECDRLIQITKQCRECGCMMPLKVKLTNAKCPIGKWN